MSTQVNQHLKICVIGSTYPLNPNDKQVPWLRESLKQLKKRGHHISVFAPSFKGRKDHEIDGIPVKRFRYAPAQWETLTHGSGAPNKVHSVSKKLWVISYIALGCIQAALFAWRERFNIIHAHWPFPHGYFSWVMRIVCRAPVVLTCHGAELALAKNSGLIRKALSTILRSHAILACNSSHTRSQIRRISKREADIYAYGSSIETASPSNCKNTFQLPIKLLFCGRLIERKGLNYLIEALPELLKSFPTQLDITGEGVCKSEWEAQVERLSLSEHVNFHGFVDDEKLADLYQSCDIYVHPAIHDSRGETEGLGVVLIEALANAKPVIASEVGGIVDVIIDKKTGILVPEKDANAITQAVITLVENPDLAHKLGKQGQDHINHYFDWGNITDKTERLYYLLNHFCKGRSLFRKTKQHP